MKRLTARFGRLVTASFFVMAAGIFIFFISIPLYIKYGIDLDIIGFIIFTVGLALGIIPAGDFGGATPVPAVRTTLYSGSGYSVRA